VVDVLGDVGAALVQGIKNQTLGKTTIIEVMCTQELGDPFRRDALQKPVRNLAKYKKLV
jgi:sulfoacetaldehyde acetyltransferase